MSFPFSVKEENHGKIKPSGQKEILLFKLVRDCPLQFYFLLFVSISLSCEVSVTLEHDELLMFQQIITIIYGGVS